MILIIGGVGQGKLAYVQKRLGLDMTAVARTPHEAKTRPIFTGLAQWIKEHPSETLVDLLNANPSVTILCDEVGCGVVPIDPTERAWRESVGRLCCRLAEQAQRVERVFCGLPMVLKGDEVWN